MYKLTKLGFHVVRSTDFYLNYISTGPDWKGYYKRELFDFNGKILKSRAYEHNEVEGEFISIIQPVFYTLMNMLVQLMFPFRGMSELGYQFPKADKLFREDI